MRILFTPLALTSHVLPMVPLAWACRAAGHDVRFAAQPPVLGTITGAGLPAVAVGASHDLIADVQGFFRRNAESLRRSAAGPVVAGGAPPTRPVFPWTTAARAIAPDVVGFARWWRPDLVVNDPMFYAGPLVSEVLDIPLARFLWGPDWTKSGFGMGGFVEGDEAARRWPDELLDLYRSYGARTVIDYAALTIDPYPPSLQIPGLPNRVTIRQMAYNGSGSVPAWAAEPSARPRVCVTWGTSTAKFMGDDAFLVPQVLADLADLDVEVVLAVGSADRGRLAAAGALPANVRVVEDVPLDLFLSTCSAIVNQGGGSTIVTAATHAVPQVIIPQMADQPVNAGLLAATGAGISLTTKPVGPGEVRAAVEAVAFGDGPRAAARKLQAEIRALPTPAGIVGTLEDLVVERAGRSAAA